MRLTISPTTGRKNSLGTVVQFLIINYRGQEWKTAKGGRFMSDNHEFIIPVGNPVKKFPSGLQELYLDVCETVSRQSAIKGLRRTI